MRTAGLRSGDASLVIFKVAEFEFVRSELATLHLPQKKSSHLHPNRPSDQLSWRTPCHMLSMKLSAAAYLLAQL
jgi:hypothetical protein